MLSLPVNTFFPPAAKMAGSCLWEADAVDFSLSGQREDSCGRGALWRLNEMKRLCKRLSRRLRPIRGGLGNIPIVLSTYSSLECD